MLNYQRVKPPKIAGKALQPAPTSHNFWLDQLTPMPKADTQTITHVFVTDVLTFCQNLGF
jgi:hypothetical protein